MTHINQYTVFVKHDSGKATFIVIASTEQVAKEKVMIAEGCPESAITKVRHTKKIPLN
jgi:ferredoxin